MASDSAAVLRLSGMRWGAIERVLSGNGPRTPDLGGRATTRDVADAILQELK